MKELKAIKQIDDVLTFMAIKENIVFYTISDIEKKMGLPQSEQIELYLILNKLIRDGYVELFEKEYADTVFAKFTSQPEIVRRYIITFEGRLHIENGGYHAKYRERLSKEKKDADQSIWVKNIETTQTEIQKKIKDLTFWIAFAAIISGAYYFLYLVLPILDRILKRP